MLSGLGFLEGMERLEVWEEDLLGPDGTAALERREGFLWVIAEGSTLRRPEVTSDPREIWSNTAPISVAPPELLLDPFVGIGGGGGGGPSIDGIGGGGGGGGAPDDVGGGDLADRTSWRACSGAMPC